MRRCRQTAARLRHAWRWWCIAIVLGLGAGCASAAPFLVGTSAHFESGKTEVEGFLVRSAQLGTNTFRTDLHWGSIEQTKGRLAFPAALAPLERAILATAAAGGAPLLILDYGNPFYDGGSFPLSDEAQAAFVRYVEFVVRRYQGKVRHYEVWNEWNIGLATGHPVPYTYPGSARDYARLLKKVYRAIKGIDPDAVVIAGAVANRDATWLQEMTAAADHHYDGISVHPYNYSARGASRSPEEAIAWVRQLRPNLPAAADGQPPLLFLTEMGWPNDAGQHGTDTETTAAWLARLYFLAKASGDIGGVWWYDYQDDGTEPLDPEHNFGLVTRRGAPKPAFFAMADVARLLVPVGPASSITLPQGLQAVRIGRQDGASVTLALWSTRDGGEGNGIILEAGGASRALRIAPVRASDGAPATLLRVGQGVPDQTVLLGTRPVLISGDLRQMTVRAAATPTLGAWLRRLLSW